MAPQGIAQVLRDLPRPNDPNLLVGTETSDDAGVYRVAPDLALVQTIDFFPPVVDDPYVFGQIAATNALSDVYAMGGIPKTVLNLVGFPDNKLPLDILNQILRGGASKVSEAGAITIGGHTVRDHEIKFGLSVTGFVHPDRIWTNAGARPGDKLILTKPLGTGFITTAAKKEKCPKVTLDAAIASMTQLNKAAAQVAEPFKVHAVTDITGFGLAGHTYEMAKGSGVTIVIDLNKLPILPGVLDLVRQQFFTRASTSNHEFVKEGLRLEGAIDETLEEVIYDAQTSGGLLISVAGEQAETLLVKVKQAGCPQAAIVGDVCRFDGASLVVRGVLGSFA
jgi:selenide,water dikinase